MESAAYVEGEAASDLQQLVIQGVKEQFKGDPERVAAFMAATKDYGSGETSPAEFFEYLSVSFGDRAACAFAPKLAKLIKDDTLRTELIQISAVRKRSRSRSVSQTSSNASDAASGSNEGASSRGSSSSGSATTSSGRPMRHGRSASGSLRLERAGRQSPPPPTSPTSPEEQGQGHGRNQGKGQGQGQHAPGPEQVRRVLEEVGADSTLRSYGYHHAKSVSIERLGRGGDGELNEAEKVVLRNAPLGLLPDRSPLLLQGSPLDVVITGCAKSKSSGSLVYQIQVSTGTGDWELEHRFSEFYSLLQGSAAWRTRVRERACRRCPRARPCSWPRGAGTSEGLSPASCSGWWSGLPARQGAGVLLQLGLLSAHASP